MPSASATPTADTGLVPRADSTLQRLDSTATLTGLFEQWDCTIGECTLLPEDTLALYTDGITEACNDAGERVWREALGLIDCADIAICHASPHWKQLQVKLVA